MVTDIFARAERHTAKGWEAIPGIQPFRGWSSYRLFGFLADVRNYSAIQPISQPRGVPPGVDLPPADFDGPDEAWLGEHDHSWLLLSELLVIDYEQVVEDRRTTGLVDGLPYGSLTAPFGEGIPMTLRQFLGDEFFEELDRLQRAGVERVIYGFSS